MNNLPDFNDPFGPPEIPCQVRCLHCDKSYSSADMRRDGKSELWVCPNYKECGGAGYGMDIHDVDDECFGQG
jgi:hypothetical protein